MRLDDSDHPAGYDRPRRLKYGGDLDRMMAVIVDDRDAVPFAGLGKASAHAFEIVEAPAHRVIVEPHLLANSDRRERVLDVMFAEHRQKQVGDNPLVAVDPARDDGVVAAAVG